MPPFRLPLRAAATVLLLISPSACNGPPWTLSRSPDQITLRWYTDDTSVDAAQAVAARYCAQMGKTATFSAISRDGSAAIAGYRCG